MRKSIPILSSLTVLALFSCGGGGDSSISTETSQVTSQQTQTTISTPTSTDTNKYTLVGYAVDDYVLNATVKVYNIQTGELLAQTTTKDLGEFTVEVPLDAELLIEIEGGLLDADGSSTTKNDQTPFNKKLVGLADIAQVQGDNKIMITPVTTAIVASILGVDSAKLMDNQVDLHTLLYSADKKQLVEAYKSALEKLPADLKPIVKDEQDLELKEKIIEKLVEKLGEPEKLAKELEDLELDGDEGLTLEDLQQVEQELQESQDIEQQTITGFYPSGEETSVPQATDLTQSTTVKVQITDNQGNPIQGANVVARILTTLRDGDSLQEVFKTTDISNQGGYGTLELKVPSNGGVLEISVIKQGFIQTVKTIKFNSSDEIPQLVKLSLAQSDLTKIVDTSQTTFSRAGGKLTIYVVKRKNTGKPLLRVGKPAISRAEDESVVFKMEVPQELYQGASKIKVEIKNFDPFNKTDVEKMPSWVDENGNQLASVAFDYVKLTNLDTGEPLKAPEIKAETEPVIIVRQVKCALLKEDYDKEKEGFQVPIYILKNGVWNYIGEGVVVTDYNGDSIKDTDQVCKNTETEYVKIEITNPDFANPYINLDYPITTDVSNVVERCVNLRFVSSNNGTPLKNIPVSLYDDDSTPDFYWTEGITDEEGKVQLKTTYYTDNTTDTTAEVGFWNEYTQKWETLKVELGDCNSQEYQNVTVVTPQLCSVVGKVVDENNQPIQVYIYAYAKDWSYYKDGKTDEEGLFSLQVPCMVDSYLQVKDKTFSFNVNGTVNGNETIDDGRRVVLNVIKVEDSPPWPGIWSSSSQYYNPQTIPVYVSAYDEEGDFPIIAKVMLLDDKGEVVTKKEVAIDRFQDYNYGETKVDVPAPQQSGIYQLDVQVTDSKGKTRRLSTMLAQWGGILPTIQIISNENPPVIWDAYSSSYGKRIFAGMYAGDIDGDLKNCTITVYNSDNNTVEPADKNIKIEAEGARCYSDYTFILNDAGNYTLVFTAEDSQNHRVSIQKSIYSPGDEPLRFEMFSDKTYWLKSGDIVSISAIFKDDDPITINNLKISVNDEDINECSDNTTVEPTNCYTISDYSQGFFYEKDIFLEYEIPNDNSTEYKVCLNATVNNETVSKCLNLYKGVPLNAQINLEIRK